MKKIIIALFTLTITASACKKEETNTPNPTTVEKPFTYLKVGNQWVYDFLFNGNIVDSLVTTIENKANDEYEVKTFDMTRAETSYQFIDGDYIKQYNKGQTKANAVRIGKSNPVKGDTWFELDNNRKDSIIYTITDINMPITVKAGTFKCTRIEIAYPAGTRFITYADPMYSIVKMEFYSANQQNPAVYNLRRINF